MKNSRQKETIFFRNFRKKSHSKFEKLYKIGMNKDCAQLIFNWL